MNKCNFIILGGTKGINTQAFINNFAEKRKTINIFDYDASGKKLFDEIFKHTYQKENIYIKQINHNNIGIMLKSENITDYKKQIDCGYIPIELMYSKSKINNLVKKVENAGGIGRYYWNSDKADSLSIDDCFIISNKEDEKLAFANEVKNFDSDDFKGFKPTLDLVLKVIEKWEKKVE